MQNKKLFGILNVDGKTLRQIQNLFWTQIAAVRCDGKFSERMKIKTGLRQGCILSPNLFSLYSEVILREIEDPPELAFNDHNVNNIPLLMTQY